MIISVASLVLFPLDAMTASTVSTDDELHMDPSKVSAQLDRLANLDNCDASEESISTIIRSILPHSQHLEANQSQVFIDALDKVSLDDPYTMSGHYIVRRP